MMLYRAAPLSLRVAATADPLPLLLVPSPLLPLLLLLLLSLLPLLPR
jgi:hypothetical protein